MAVQIVVTAAVLWFVGDKLYGQWKIFRGAPTGSLHPRWELIALSCVVVFVTYGVLIATMQRIVVAWGQSLSFMEVARIWSLSNLARYLPGSQVVQLATMAELARRRKVSSTIVVGAALINTLVNLAAGFVVALVAGWKAVDVLSNGHAALGVAVVVAVLIGLLLLPFLLPWLVSILRRLTGRDLVLGVFPRRVVYEAIVGNLISWILSGIAFQLLVAGVLGVFHGSTLSYIAVWAVSYLLGYLVFVLPAGIGVREASQTQALGMLALATASQAAIIPLCARLWLTVLEITPGLLFLAHGARVRFPQTESNDGAKS